MQIMCLNGWGGKLNEALLPYLIETAPDVLCLQEVVHTPTSDKDWLTYRDGAHILPQRANFFRDVCRALPEHTATFCPAAQGELWDGESSIPSQWGLATFVHRRLPVVGQVQEFVHKDFSPHSYGDHPRSRSVHGVRIYDYDADRFIAVTHMHGLRDLNGKMDTPERAKQAQNLLAAAKSIAQPGDLEVICGDFNIEPDSETLRVLGDAGYTELVKARGIESTRTSHYKKTTKFADYMLVSDTAAVASFDAPAVPEVSDHRPLILDI
ncbi:MAG: endonuclease/exonuclease/phosphatase family protein [Pseudomonadota bacterium]